MRPATEIPGPKNGPNPGQDARKLPTPCRHVPGALRGTYPRERGFSHVLRPAIEPTDKWPPCHGPSEMYRGKREVSWPYWMACAVVLGVALAGRVLL
jgi:hypothetical protein